MEKRRLFKVVLLSLVFLLFAVSASAAVSDYHLYRMNFPSGESRLHVHEINFSGTLSMIKPSSFTITGYTGSPSISGDNITWTSNSSTTVYLNLTSPSSCSETETFTSQLYDDGSLLDEFVYVCIDDYDIRDCKIEYGHGDANYLSQPYISSDSVTIFNLIRVWNIGQYLSPDEDASDANIRCYFDNFTVRTYGHGDVTYNETNVMMDFFWDVVYGGYWFRIGVLSQDFTGEPVGDYYNITCDELTYGFEHQNVIVPGFDCSLEVRSCDALQISVENYSVDLTKAKVTITNNEVYDLHNLYFEKIYNGLSGEEHIMRLESGDSAYFLADRNDNYNYTFYFLPSWYHNSRNPQYCSQLLAVDDGGPIVEVIWPPTSSIYYHNETVEIRVLVTDETGVDYVYVNVTIPGDGTVTVPLTDPDGDNIYAGIFTNTTEGGTYELFFWANDTTNNINSYEQTHFTVMTSTGGGSTNNYYYSTTNIDRSHHGGDDDVYNYYNITNISISVTNISQGGEVVVECDCKNASEYLKVTVEEREPPICDEFTSLRKLVATVTNDGDSTRYDVLIRVLLPEALREMVTPRTSVIKILEPGEPVEIEFILDLDLCNEDTPSMSSFPIGMFPFIVEADDKGLRSFGDVLIDFRQMPEFSVEIMEDGYCEDDWMKVCFMINNLGKDLREKLEIEFMVYDEEKMYLGDFLSSYAARENEVLIISKEYPIDFVPKNINYTGVGYLYQNGSLFKQRYLVGEDDDVVELNDCKPVFESPGRVCYLPGWLIFVLLLLLLVVMIVAVSAKVRKRLRRRRCLFFSLVMILLAILLWVYYLYYCRVCTLWILVILLLLIPLLCILHRAYRRCIENTNAYYCEEREVRLKGTKNPVKMRFCHIYAPFLRPLAKRHKKKKAKLESEETVEQRAQRLSRIKGEVGARSNRLHIPKRTAKGRKKAMIGNIKKAHKTNK